MHGIRVLSRAMVKRKVPEVPLGIEGHARPQQGNEL
jgi:hypothetical protein